MNSLINKPATVTSVYFSTRGDLKAFPRRVECDGREYTFQDGVECIVQKGQQAFSVFTMTDGQQRFRLRCQTGAWTLLGIG